MFKIKKNLELKKIILKRITTPLRISKKINDMKFKFNKIYRNFYLSSTDLKKQKEIEEYQKYQTMLKYKRQNFIKNTKIYFEEKINLKEIYPNKSAKFKENNKLYFNIIINYDKKFIYQPYLLPIRKRDYIKRYYPTDPNRANIINKIKSNNRRYAMSLFGSKKLTKSFLKKSKSALNINKRNENAKNETKKNLNSNLNALKIDKNKIIKIKKSLNIKNKDNKNNFKTPNNFLRKKLIFVENNHPLNNIENIVSPIKQINDINNSNLNNINLNLNIDKENDEQNLINIQNNININNDNLILNKNIFNEKLDNNNSNNNVEAKNISFKSINSNSNSRNNNKESISPRSISLKYSIENSKNKPYNYIMFNKNKNEASSKKKTINLYNINKKTISIYEQNKNAFKLLPILNKTFNSTISKSARLNKNIKSFRKEAKIRTKYSKRKTNKITKKYFDKIVAPTIKSTLRIAKKKSWPKEMYNYIQESKSGHINLKFSYEKKKKSPLTFVEEYNRMRNRRRKNNKKITANIGFGILQNKEIKENKLKAYFGLSFNANKYY